MLVCLAAAAWPRVAGVGNLHETDPGRMDLLLDAIAQVESRNEPDATGDGGRAAGVYQIHRAYWDDGVRWLGADWDYTQATDPAKARAVVKAYLLHYGRGCSLLEMARIHNGGPNGHRKQSTQGYARRVAQIMDEASRQTVVK